MNAFITGSRAYGIPRDDSDIDLVVLCSENTKAVLASGQEGAIRFGNLNIIPVTSNEEFYAWLDATEFLCEIQPVGRETAKRLIKKYCREAGCHDSDSPSSQE